MNWLSVQVSRFSKRLLKQNSPPTEKVKIQTLITELFKYVSGQSFDFVVSQIHMSNNECRRKCWLERKSVGDDTGAFKPKNQCFV
ncbi:hypothetical protein LSH36_2365g00002 [Paralvinella palmiformis]|uniref:Uncharacterized protein n=1 Tax=Paralvinella palmiformis TaxID=53620 RepID=A0AAD9MPD5_9ANNE|nr:hypothetical protein LSH36_2365g00002 [Paralvinella palmiformis]